MTALIQIADYLLTVVAVVIVVQGVLSFLIAFNVINTHNRFVDTVWDGLNRLTAPLYRPIRRAMRRLRIDTGALDLSPLVVLVIIEVLRILLWNAYSFGFA